MQQALSQLLSPTSVRSCCVIPVPPFRRSTPSCCCRVPRPEPAHRAPCGEHQEGSRVSGKPPAGGEGQPPSLPDHPDHALYEKYFPNGGASIFTFNIKGGREEAFKFIDNLKIFSLLANVADVKSLVIHPASTTHSQLNDEELAEQQIYQNTIRLSIGTEHIDDIIADLEAGFAAVRGE